MLAGGALTTITLINGGTDADRDAGTYVIAIPTTGAGASTSAVVTVGTGTNTGGTSLQIAMVVDGPWCCYSNYH